MRGRMHYWLAVTTTLLAIGLAACSSSASEQATSTDEVAVATTATVGEVTTTVQEATTTTAEPATPPTTAPEIDDSALANSKTWEDYLANVDRDRAIFCAVKGEANSAPDFARGIDKDTASKIFDVYFTQLDSDDAADIEVYESFVQLEPTAVVGNFVRKVRRAHELLVASAPDEPVASLTETLEELSRLEQLIDDGATEIDLAPFFRRSLERNSLDYEFDIGCPFAGGTPTIVSAMQNFAGTNEKFGGRGPQARSRCVGSAAISLTLEDLIDPETPDRVELADHAFAMFNYFWQDRDADAAAAEVSASWSELSAALSTSLTPEDRTAIEGVLSSWLAYRETAPEGFILCPLDKGWEA